VPALKYLRGDYLEFVKGILNQRVARERELFNPDYVHKLLQDPEAHITRLRGSKLWQVALLEYWLQVHNV
jgi:asparagine synthase (glutamine-hydrolysing)